MCKVTVCKIATNSAPSASVAPTAHTLKLTPTSSARSRTPAKQLSNVSPQPIATRNDATANQSLYHNDGTAIFSHVNTSADALLDVKRALARRERFASAALAGTRRQSSIAPRTLRIFFHRRRVCRVVSCRSSALRVVRVFVMCRS